MSRRQELIETWFSVYVDREFITGAGDTHEEFSKRMDIPRDTAKRLCYQIAYEIYKSPVMDCYKGE